MSNYYDHSSTRFGGASVSTTDRETFENAQPSQDDIALDDFDRVLLSNEHESRLWQASNGGQRLTMPAAQGRPYSSNSSARRISHVTPVTPRPHQLHLRSQLSQFVHEAPSCGNQERSSSPSAGFSSPTVGVTKRRNDHLHRDNGSNQRCQTGLATASEALLSPQTLHVGQAPLMASGIPLIQTADLPGRFRVIFPFPHFNAVQSKCFKAVFSTDDNVVMSSPTGSGKTAILELAVCRLMSGYQAEQYKIVYQAPTKSLCSERQRDWQSKFAPLGLQCAELTGDTEFSQLRNVQNASIIITTPEKWDSVTRKWKDHQKLMQLVKLFLIDEVHILKESRGATLEAVVSRMKSVGSAVRFVALSATVPNSDDIATWLGKDSTNQHLPAYRETFGEEFRPVKLQKFVYGYNSSGNDFAFDKVCESKMTEVIARHSQKKPIMVFCCTRPSAVATAKNLAEWWSKCSPRDRFWTSPTQKITVQNKELQACISSGVAFHHAGIDGNDRQIIEKEYLRGQINVICCTSTLAVGINLPCHMVIIKNTVSWVTSGLKEYADLEVMQMLGRAGRPQFDTSATAIVMTTKQKQKHYETMVSGQEILESCLHLHLIDHLNAEIGLGTVTDLHSATRWLAGTFLSVRLRKNPNHYKLDGGNSHRDIEERMEEICERDINQLKEAQLVSAEGRLQSTEFGDAMARYYVTFETMRTIMALNNKAKMSEILSAIAQAQEFKEVRFKSAEKALLKDINRSPGIKFPIKVDIALVGHKISLIIQFELGGIEFPKEEAFSKYKQQFHTDKSVIFAAANRLVRCIVDCQIHLKDSVATRNALELTRSLAARVWDNSPLQMKQIPQLGNVGVRKLVNANIRSLEDLEATEAYQIDTILSRNTTFGNKILDYLKDFPKLRVSLTMVTKEVKAGEGVTIKARAEIGFLNEKNPSFWLKKPIYVCFLAEVSDGRLIEFRRISAKKIGRDHNVAFTAQLRDPTDFVSCFVMCDEIAGSMRYADLKLDLPASLFPTRPKQISALSTNPMDASRAKSNFENGVEPRGFTTARRVYEDVSEYGDDDLNDEDLQNVVDEDSHPPRSCQNSIPYWPNKTALTTKAPKLMNHFEDLHELLEGGQESWKPIKLDNGKWACNHKCKDRNSCKHLCCREGLDRPPKAPKGHPSADTSKTVGGQTHIIKAKGKPSAATIMPTLFNSRPMKPSAVEVLDLSEDTPSLPSQQLKSQDYRKLNKLHSSVQKQPIQMLRKKQPLFSYRKGNQPDLAFLKDDSKFPAKENVSDEYDDGWIDDLPASLLTESQQRGKDPQYSFDDDDFIPKQDDYMEDASDLEIAMVGLADSMELSSQDVPGANNIGNTLQANVGDLERQQNAVKMDYSSSPAKPSFVTPGLAAALGKGSNGLFLRTSSPIPSVHLGVGSGYERGGIKRPMEPSGFDYEAAMMPISKAPRLGGVEELIPEEILPLAHSSDPLIARKGDTTNGEMDGIDPDLLAEFADIVDFY